MVHREPDARTVIRARGTPAEGRELQTSLRKKRRFFKSRLQSPHAPGSLQAVPGAPGASRATKPRRRPLGAQARPAPTLACRGQGTGGGREGQATHLERSRDGPLMHRKTETGAATRSGRGPTSAMTHGLARDDHSDRLPRVEGLSSMRWPDQPEDARMCYLPRALPGWLTFRENGCDRNPHPICRNASPRQYARSLGRRGNGLTARTWMAHVP